MAGLGVEVIPAGGDGIATLGQHLLRFSDSEEPSVVLAINVNGSTVQRLLEHMQTCRASCHLVVAEEDDSPEAWFGRSHTAVISAARIWGQRAVQQSRRVAYILPWAARPEGRTGQGGRCLGI
eukprot:4861841-Lingulodinium_polyedra.AAC.1